MAEEVGRLIAERKGIVVTGGLSGVMEAVSRGAKNAGGLVIGILPGFDKRDANEFVDIAVTTGMGWMRNTLTVRAADAVIMISGGIGTLNELTVAYELKPTVILEGSGGWSSRIREIAYGGSTSRRRRSQSFTSRRRRSKRWRWPLRSPPAARRAATRRASTPNGLAGPRPDRPRFWVAARRELCDDPRIVGALEMQSHVPGV